MDRLTKRKIMFNGVMKKREKNVLEVGTKKYLITNFLAKRLRLKNWLLGLMTLVFSLIYLFSIEKYSNVPLDGANSYLLIEGLTTTFLFLFSIVIGFIAISVMLIPKELEKYIKNELF
ncbi:hypothetical protein SAMN04488700_0594 [Carnobacterium iners]|uniref:Uncharacterized protein n=1 Tax=Carnobacterium iners TaxID=1073423 RepID=A0A1X7MRH0_9LACT|nr:hypothetical protein [Carnobacterium iners]SEL37009.1 hypothetical protein SAMN04488114_1632 [Carnobacterium iners]SMH27295.1 hypothetical protein SAMN04488700_0594 [Carnobacterium iners]